MTRLRHTLSSVLLVVLNMSCSGTPPANTCDGNSVAGNGTIPCAAGGMTASGGSSASGGTSAAGGSSTSTAGCPGTGGPAMVRLPLGYCIDSTEVTQAQYQAWLNTNPSTSNQISVCSWNASFTPQCNWTPTTTPNYPVICVDWCDAYAYCAGVGKRLCGKIGGGSNGYADYANATLSQWYAACTSNGTYLSTGYSYGNTYQPKYCNGYDYWGSLSTEKALPVGSLSTCQSTVSGYTGVYDLSGNVSEWEDSCDGATGESDSCLFRGGPFNGDSGVLECGSVNYHARVVPVNLDIGIRCCSQ